MSDGHGGYRKPANPAAVSGPGKLSQRTDGGPSQPLRVANDQEYGDRKATLDQERGAAMYQQAVPKAGAVQVPQPPQGPTGPQGPAFGAPTAQPGVPVTSGVAVGPGPGPEALSFQSPQAVAQNTGAMSRMLAQIAPTDGSGVVAQLLAKAQSLGV